MFLVDFIFAAIFSFIALACFIMAGSKGPWNNLGTLFLVVFLITLAGGLWIGPRGPMMMGSYWIPYLVIAGLTALLLANFISNRSTEVLRPPEEELTKADSPQTASIAALGVAFWIFVCALIISIAVSFLL